MLSGSPSENGKIKQLPPILKLGDFNCHYNTVDFIPLCYPTHKTKDPFWTPKGKCCSVS